MDTLLFVENSQKEGKRLEEEAKSLEPFELPNGLKISFRAYPTLTDGKVKVNWSQWEKKAMSNCLICRAGPKKMGKRNARFKPNKAHFNFGIACLHLRINAFLWLCKIYLYQDIQCYQKTKAQEPLFKQRLEELRVKMKEELDLEVFKLIPGHCQAYFLLDSKMFELYFLKITQKFSVSIAVCPYKF